nr:MAG TPA: Type I restriction enzyme [Caudoviricetes sp.]
MKLFTNNTDFYPTPEEVINTMMMGENIIGKTILEPSAGSGNIVRWLKNNGAGEVIACEKDKHLQKLLAGECQQLAEDFLSVMVEQVSHIDYIVMNPPFSEGIRHIRHAFEIAPAGCTIVALCNSTNLEKTWNSEYVTFQELVKLYGNSEYIGTAFDTAERKTDVGISIVKLYKEGEADEEFADYLFSNEDDTLNANQTEGLVQYNLVRDLVNRYVSAVKLFDETMAAANKINDMARFDDGDRTRAHYLPIEFGAYSFDGKHIHVTRQQYKKQMQRYYWRIIFDKLNMEKYATNGLREQLNRFIEKQVEVPFTMHNVYQLLNMVIQTTGQRMDKALLEAFDLICSLSAENSTAGEKWKTNANYMVNRKFIVPYMTSYDARWPRDYVTLSYSSNETKVTDVVKALCYITGTNYDSIRPLNGLIYESKIPYGEWFEWGFFRVKAFKKGTMHFEFLDEAVWAKFNQAVAKQRGWVLPKKSGNKRKQ